jgi:uncharacterized protein (TIGR02268 family)
MRNPVPSRFALLLALAAPVALASDRDEVSVRTVQVSEHPEFSTDHVYVKGQVVTVLRFEQPVDAAKTKMLGWEGRLEPLGVVGNKVILEPVRDLASDEGIPLVVTLTDGTAIPFLLRPPQYEEWPWTDQQVNVVKNRESYAAMYSALTDALRKQKVIEEENARFKKEGNSVDHAFATLLANGQVKQTPFRRERKVVLKNEDMDIIVEVFSGPGKAAVVVHLTNTYNGEPWRFRDARLTSDLTAYTARPFALRLERAQIVHGQSGRIAVVADQSAFAGKEGLVDLALEIFREDGLQQVVVMLDHTLVHK